MVYRSIKTIVSGSQSPLSPARSELLPHSPGDGEEKRETSLMVINVNAESAAEPEQIHIYFPAVVLGDEAMSGV